ncbi:MAG TPA: hypothetical protein VFL85_01385 [Candidatus Saccharimonadales bacterium]|nr:hypothetical protein [Candidatus Saccharimonadales bacterium]
MPGKLIFVSSTRNDDRTALIRSALATIPRLHYVQTVTTRPPHDDETDSFAYKFVDDAAYQSLKTVSAEWDHTDYRGHKYGIDVAAVKRLLANGESVICVVPPDLLIVNAMADHYGVTPVKIWIDTSANFTNNQPSDSLDRLSRAEHERLQNAFDFAFRPSGEVIKDQAAFTRIINRITQKETL